MLFRLTFIRQHDPVSRGPSLSAIKPLFKHHGKHMFYAHTSVLAKLHPSGKTLREVIFGFHVLEIG
jgi:hypothetical protein